MGNFVFSAFPKPYRIREVEELKLVLCSKYLKGYAIKTKPKRNCMLTGMLQMLQSKLPGSAFALSDTFKFLLELKEQGQKYGINDTSNPCCPIEFEGSLYAVYSCMQKKRDSSHSDCQ
ncbi:GDSL esterase/lipase family [Melia azedarach]|uniref:GDSL esterase/lipase family n=1 Tax=Melia azedarach TaxID=155640 RepID=A0ACC1XJ68_MELAZ|nr:GDSL esterase/lipase family [Melia azedarach]